MSELSQPLMAGPMADPSDVFPILGVPVTDTTMAQALAMLEAMLLQQPSRTHATYFVNAHTLNLACDDPRYRAVLQRADRVFGDGTGVRWAARLIHGVGLQDNVNGTDLTPLLFQRLAGRGLRYFLLGNTPERIERAAAHAQKTFAGWTLAGCHHGYLNDGDHDAVVDKINASGAHLLLVGMGNPRQEQWIDAHRARLNVPLCLGTGGLFDYWVGDLVRAPGWVRRLGHEWLHLLLSQPHKARRYLLGNPKFLLRVARSRLLLSDSRERP
jgi:N-acetylglucosaminyldiphosphoundecaprenol N-acetyl-beta-D-mannosaminyltransferase